MRPALVRFLLPALLLLLPGGARSQEPPPIVHAVLFYSPTCPHCHQVITEHLVPMQSSYGSRLVILAFDVTQQYGHNLYQEMLRAFEVPQDNWVVPILVAGDSIMIGGFEIPGRFPTMVESGLAGNGLDLPNLPGLLTFLGDQDLLETRFPGRRMTKVPADLLSEARPPARDSAVADSVAPAGAPPADSTMPGADSSRLAPADTARAGGERAAIRPDTASGATPPARTPPAAEPGRTPTASQAAPPPASGETGRVPPDAAGGGEASVPDSGAAISRDSAAAIAPPPAPGGEAPLGLAQAARDIESAGMWDRFRRDPVGNSLSVVILGLMVASLLFSGYPPRAAGRRWPEWLVPVLVVVGAGVASYLSFIEVTHAEAVCGPVGDCNTVNQSEYARLFGVLPVGVLGLVGYAVIFLLWLLARGGPEGMRAPATLGLWGAALFGTLFSIYLTFLEPFIIGATCAWCLSSAVIMTLLLWVTAPMAARVWPGGAGAEGVGARA